MILSVDDVALTACPASSMTELLKNLFTVYFQFELLKLETNYTCDDKVKHAWIIARWTVGWGGLSLTTVAMSQVVLGET
jgi:hypothetical protein